MVITERALGNSLYPASCLSHSLQNETAKEQIWTSCSFIYKWFQNFTLLPGHEHESKALPEGLSLPPHSGNTKMLGFLLHSPCLGVFFLLAFSLAIPIPCDPHKGFGIVNKAKIDVFPECSCFFHDPADVGNLFSGSSAFSKTSLNIREFTVQYCWSLAWRILSITLLATKY